MSEKKRSEVADDRRPTTSTSPKEAMSATMSSTPEIVRAISEKKRRTRVDLNEAVGLEILVTSARWLPTVGLDLIIFT